AASVRSGLPLVLASYPITPASELLHELARHQEMGVRTIQAEDEIAAAGMALGAAFGGALGVTATSGPGMDLKAETIGLAAMLELPMVVIDVQRAGPSTGMPTKTELSDLFLANSSEPWRIPDANALAPIDPDLAEPREDFQPYARDEKGARPWAVPGTPGVTHRIGGLQKQDVTGD